MRMRVEKLVGGANFLHCASLHPVLYWRMSNASREIRVYDSAHARP